MKNYKALVLKFKPMSELLKYIKIVCKVLTRNAIKKLL